MNNNSQDRYAVFGNPIHHSKSPTLQMAFAEQTKQNILYTAECVDVDRFSDAANLFFSEGGKGLNITVPFKIEAFNYADKLTDRAKKAGAVNTLLLKGNTIVGDNTDGVGFVNDVTQNLKWILKEKNILILGAGGAVRGILEPLLNTLPSKVVVANRTVEKAISLVKDFTSDGVISACHYDELNESFDIIINATSASLNGELPNLPNNLLSKNACCYDMMYGKDETVFMKWAKQENASSIVDGLGMLVCQGAESFFQWRGVSPKTQVVVDQLRKAL